MITAERITLNGIDIGPIAPYWEWLLDLRNSQLAKDIERERMAARPDTPEAFYWEERCPTNALVRRPRRALVKR